MTCVLSLRQAWGPHIDLRDPRLLAFAAAERQFLQSEYDEYAITNSGTLTCFRSVAVIVSKPKYILTFLSYYLFNKLINSLFVCVTFHWQLMLLLLIRQTLLITRDFGMLRESSVFVHVSPSWHHLLSSNASSLHQNYMARFQIC